MSPGHREALAQLLYGTPERTGFILLTDKVGAGKTVLLHTLRQRLSGHSAIAFVPNSTLPFDELLGYVLEDLGISKPGQSRAQRLIAFNNFLIEQERTDQTTVLIIDAAQIWTSRQWTRFGSFRTSRPPRASSCHQLKQCGPRTARPLAHDDDVEVASSRGSPPFASGTSPEPKRLCREAVSTLPCGGPREHR